MVGVKVSVEWSGSRSVLSGRGRGRCCVVGFNSGIRTVGAPLMCRSPVVAGTDSILCSIFYRVT